MTYTDTTETTDNGVKEPRKIRHKFGNGPSWDVPVDVIKALLDSAWSENPEFMGRHLQAALTGEMPKRGRARRNGSDEQ